jgi:hypothetical protein
MFTIITVAGEETCVHHPHMLRTTTEFLWSLVREDNDLELLLVTFALTLWRRCCCRVVS